MAFLNRQQCRALCGYGNGGKLSGLVAHLQLIGERSAGYESGILKDPIGFEAMILLLLSLLLRLSPTAMCLFATLQDARFR